MEEYTITEDGRLIHHAVAYEMVQKAERPHPEAGGLLGLAGSIRRLPKGDVEILVHGDLEFYYDENLGWWSYIARFTEERCVRIWLHEHRPPASVQTHK